MAHGGEEQHEALLVLGEIGRLLGGLGHQDRVAGGVEAVEGGAVGVELVAEDDDETAEAAGRFGALLGTRS
jgi:hypothetical protein